MRYLILIIAILLVSCQTSPDRENYPCDECYMAADSLYRMKDAKDKSSVVPLLQACSDALKEKRIIARLEYCKKNKTPGMTERECLLLLNQK